LRLCDGLFAAGMFHMFHRLSDNLTMANLAQLVNALPAIVTNNEGELYVNPVYLAFKLYRNNTGKIVLRTSTTSASTLLDVSATMDEDGSRLYLAVINKDLTEKANASISLKDFKPKQTCEVFQLNGPSWDSQNNFSSPDTVKITSKNVTIDITDESFVYNFEPHSVTILVLEKQPVHDVAVTSVTPDPTEVTIGENVTIPVVVENNGIETETFDVTAYYNTTAIDTQTVTSLAAGANQTLTFTWDTTGVAAGNYTIKAKASLTGDENIANDELTADDEVKVKSKPGIPWLWIIVVVVVVVIIAAYMLVRKRRI
jgi:hypothetical protein